MSAIIWRIFDMEDIKSPETEMRPICWELLRKKSWNHNEWTYFVADFNLLEPLCPPVFVPGHSIVSHLNTSYFCKLQRRLTTQQNRAAAATIAAYFETAQDIIRNRLYLIVPRFFAEIG